MPTHNSHPVHRSGSTLTFIAAEGYTSLSDPASPYQRHFAEDREAPDWERYLLPRLLMQRATDIIDLQDDSLNNKPEGPADQVGAAQQDQIRFLGKK